MKRRNFFGTVIASGFAGTLPVSTEPIVPKTQFISSSLNILPETIAGMSLEELRDDYHDRLFNRYIPFWDKGGSIVKTVGLCVN